MPSTSRKRRKNEEEQPTLAEYSKAAISAFAAQAKQHEKDASDSGSSANASDAEYHDPLYRHEAQGSDYDAAETDEEIPRSPKPRRSDTRRSLNDATIYEPVQLSTWKPSPENVKADGPDSIRVILRSIETLLFIGTYDIEVLEGAVSIYGAILEQGSQKFRVYAPSTHPIPTIAVPQTVQTREAVFKISSCQNALHRLRPVSPLFGRIHNELYEPLNTLSHIKQPSFAYVEHSASDPLKRYLQPLTVPSTWTSTFEKISRTERGGVPRVLVCGAKGTGKSTFARVLLNHYLSWRPRHQSSNARLSPTTTVCYLDLDPGQPEFSPPYQLSLVHVKGPVFGPPYTHALATPCSSFRIVRAHSTTASNPKEDPQHYIACASDLLQRYRELLHIFPLCPLIINTCGWVHGEGLEILTELLQKLDLSAVIGLGFEDATEDTGTQETLDALKTASHSSLFQLLDSEPKALLSRTAADLRSMQSISYLHAKDDGPKARWTRTPIPMRETLPLSYHGKNQDVLALIHLNDGGPALRLWNTVLNEALVGVVYVEDDGLAQQISRRIRRTPTYNLPILKDRHQHKVIPLDPVKCRLLGLAFIKDIGLDTGAINIITPNASYIYDMCRRSNTPLRDEVGGASEDEEHADRKSSSPRIVLVQGYFDAPAWAQMSLVHYQRHRQRKEEVITSQVHSDAKVESDLHTWLVQQMADSNDDIEDTAQSINTTESTAAWRELHRAGARYLEPVEPKIHRANFGARWHEAGTK